MRKVVVFCSDVYTSIGLIRCLGEAGHRPECVIYGPQRNWTLASRYISKGFGFDTKEEAIKFLVDEYPTEQIKPILLTIPDPPAYLVDKYYNLLKYKFILSNAGEQGRIIYWMNKEHISELAHKYGFKIPWTIRLSKASPIPKDLKYPVFTKNVTSSDGGKFDEGICNNYQELLDRQQSITSNEFLVMQYINRKAEVNYLGLAIGGKVYIDYHDLRERFPKAGYGHYNSFHKVRHDEFYERMICMMKETNYEGLFDVEFLVDADGSYYFMEINFRVDGEVYKLVPGINYPAEWCRLIELPTNSLPDSLETRKEYIVGITEIEDFKTSVIGGLVNPLKWLVEFLKADKRMMFNMKDPLPSLVWIGSLFKRRMRL